MSKRKHYSPEYKRELVELVRRAQSSCRKIALEVGVNPNMLTHWVREADAGGSISLRHGHRLGPDAHPDVAATHEMRVT
jgi:transposase-like protein